MCWPTDRCQYTFSDGMAPHDKGMAKIRVAAIHLENVYTTLDNPNLSDEVKEQQACDYASMAISSFQTSSATFT